MGFQQIFKSAPKLGRDTRGMALFMVLASVGLLSILVTDFVYITQVSQAIAYGGLDQAQAHYLAKGALKLSLLRLKAYQKLKATVGQFDPTGNLVPRSMIEKIWSYPFFYPIPTGVPGLTPADRDLIKKFQDELGIDGKFSATIESESSRYNLNQMLAVASSTPVPLGSSTPSATPTETSTAALDPVQSREQLAKLLTLMLNQKMETDSEFASSYRDLRVPELMDQLAAWADRKYERISSPSRDTIPMKRAPFYSLSELHYLPLVDDELYRFLSPQFTTSMTSSINLNMIGLPLLRSLVPRMTQTEAEEFFKFRDSEVADRFFKKPDEFVSYLEKNVAFYRGNGAALSDLKEEWKKRGISFTTEETVFKITVRATVNSATRTIQAWVTLGSGSEGSLSLDPPPGGGLPVPDSGIKITYMKMD